MKIQTQLGIVLAALLGTVAASQADIVANFSGGNGNSSANQYQGTSGGGWNSGWDTFLVNGVTAGSSTGVVTDGSFITSGGGNYLRATLTANQLSVGGSGFVRRYFDGSATGVLATNPYAINFDFRAENAPANGQFYQFYAVSGSSQTWTIRAYADGTWSIIGRNDTQGSTTVVSNLSNISFATGSTYHITIAIDPTTKHFVTTVTDGTNTGTSSLYFRQNANDGGTALLFGIFTAPDATHTNNYTFDLDNVNIASVPEVATLGVLLPGCLLLAKKR